MRSGLILALLFLLNCGNVYAQDNSGSFYSLNFSFYHSEGIVEGEGYSFNHLGLDLEKNWRRPKFRSILSGYSVGYRKEEMNNRHFGHFINLGIFRKFDTVAGVYIKPALKLEWGLPSDRLDHAVFRPDGSYTYVYLLRNSNLPEGINRGFLLWPVVDVRIGREISLFVFEAGLRGGYPEVVKEEYHISTEDFQFEVDKRRIVIPSAVVMLGIKF